MMRYELGELSGRNLEKSNPFIHIQIIRETRPKSRIQKSQVSLRRKK